MIVLFSELALLVVLQMLEERSVPIDEHDTRELVQGKLRKSSAGTAVYPNESEHFPSAADTQGVKTDIKDKNISVSDWLDAKCAVMPSGVQIHPHTTHLILFDQPSKTRGVEQKMPWLVVDDIHACLRKHSASGLPLIYRPASERLLVIAGDQGVMEGLLLVHGDTSDLQAAKTYLDASRPVITLKSTGGASDYLSMKLEERQSTHDRPQTMAYVSD